MNARSGEVHVTRNRNFHLQLDVVAVSPLKVKLLPSEPALH
jgi:hypothetical protein